MGTEGRFVSSEDVAKTGVTPTGEDHAQQRALQSGRANYTFSSNFKAQFRRPNYILVLDHSRKV